MPQKDTQRIGGARPAAAGFTLIELLVVIGIVALLISVLLPTLRRARIQAQQTTCMSNLRQVGQAILMYVNDHQGRLPLIIEPLWRADTGAFDFSANPADSANAPLSFFNVMKKYTGDNRVLLCPAARSGYPQNEPLTTYRISSANNSDGRVELYEQLFTPSGYPKYTYNLKYLNGRRYELKYADEFRLPFALTRGVGLYYLFRDMTALDPRDSSLRLTPHVDRQYNKLMLDMSVKVEKDQLFQVSYP